MYNPIPKAIRLWRSTRPCLPTDQADLFLYDLTLRATVSLGCLPVGRKNSKHRHRDAKGRFLPNELEPEMQSAASPLIPVNRFPLIELTATPQPNPVHKALRRYSKEVPQSMSNKKVNILVADPTLFSIQHHTSHPRMPTFQAIGDRNIASKCCELYKAILTFSATPVVLL